MTLRVYQFPVTIAAGTPVNNPATVDTAFDVAMQPVEVSVRVPPGPRGEVGFRIVLGNQQLVPWNSGAWVVTDDEEMVWDMSDQSPSGDYAVMAYNTGTYSHTLLVRWKLSVTTSGAVSGATVPPPVALSVIQGGG